MDVLIHPARINQQRYVYIMMVLEGLHFPKGVENVWDIPLQEMPLFSVIEFGGFHG